jgi:acetyltransferase-like isoleucine patch superfamily enzyme
MKKYTRDEFDAIPSQDNRKTCPTGDYSDLKVIQANYPTQLSFAPGCVFGSNTVFSRGIYFGQHSRFGSHCQFGSSTNIGPGSYIGEGTTFEGPAYIGSGSTTGDDVVFGACSRIGNYVNMGKHCEFGAGAVIGEGSQVGAYSTIGQQSRIGDFTVFGDEVTFGVGCLFANSVVFGEDSVFEGQYRAMPGFPYLQLAGAGSMNRTTIFFNTTDGILVRSGCFFGTLDAFVEKVLEDEESPLTLKSLQYLGMANLVKQCFTLQNGETAIINKPESTS